MGERVLYNRFIDLLSQLDQMVGEKNNLTDPSVVKISQQLDEVVVQLQMRRNQVQYSH